MEAWEAYQVYLGLKLHFTTDKYDYHYFGWNYDFLKVYLMEAGFKNLEKVKSFGLFDDTSDYAPYNDGSGQVPISLNVIAHK